VKQITDIF